MHHLKDRLFDHKLRHKKSKIESQAEIIDDVKENVKADAEASVDHKDVLPALHPVTVHNTRMRMVAARNFSQQQDQNSTDPSDPPKDTDLPPALLKAKRHMEIFAARNAPPVDAATKQIASRIQNSKTKMVTPEGGLGMETDTVKPSDLPPELLRSQRHMAIIASRHAAPPADAKAVTTEDPSSLPMPVQRLKVRAIVNPDKTPPPVTSNESELPPELLEAQRHIAILASRHAAPPVDAKAVVEPDTNSPPSVIQRTKVRVAADQKLTTLKAPNGCDIIRYRYHYGTNLGSIYVLEKWLMPSAFPDDIPEGQTSELSCVSQWVKRIGVDGTRQKFEERWTKAMAEDDWKWLVNDGHSTSIRLPIGYFTLGPEYCKGTPFETYGPVYENAWGSVKKFVECARTYGIGVLIDLHALPGGANEGEHSGTNLKAAELWKNTANLDLAIRCLTFIAHELGDIDGVIGIQLCNEAVTDADGIYDWWFVLWENAANDVTKSLLEYDQVIAAISAVSPSLPLFISDAWDLGKAVQWVKTRNHPEKKLNPLVIDTHLYFCFDDEHKTCSPDQILEKVPKTLSQVGENSGAVLDSGALSVVVGEYACTLDPDTWKKFQGSDEDKISIRKRLGSTQCEHFSSTTSGAFYWTLKMDWMDGGDWGFVAQSKSGAVAPPEWLKFSHDEVNGRSQNADSKCSTLRDRAYKAQVDRWAKSPDAKTAPESYKKGWDLGWNDAKAFFRYRSEGRVPIRGADKIGLKDLWILKRISESALTSENAREFEQGMWKGITDFEAVALD